MAEQGDTQKLFTQLQVLKNEVEQVSNVNSKLDNAIDKLRGKENINNMAILIIFFIIFSILKRF